jgi:hypothetical protein
MSSTPGRCTQNGVVGTKGANADEFDIVHSISNRLRCVRKHGD